MTKINHKFTPSPESTLERVRLLSEKWSKPLRKLVCIGVKKPVARNVNVWRPWGSGTFSQSWLRDL